MITHNRRVEALRSVGRLLALPERPALVVVDSGSSERAFGDALRSALWVLAERRRVPPAVEARLAALDDPERRSMARRYVG
jgi:hypothetical protein